jgi:hypothetical protein
MRFPRLVPSPALVVACLALVVAAAQPVASAVGALVPNNSVGTAQLKDGAVTTPKLHGSAVTSGKIANGTVSLLDLAPAARAPKSYAVSEGFITLPAAGSEAVLAAIDLPAGSWVLISKSVATTGSNGTLAGNVTCQLYKGDFSLDFGTSHSQVFAALTQSYTHTIPLAAVTTGAGHVELRCSKNNELVASVVANKLVAIKVTP